MDKFENKILTFVTAIQDVYKNEEDRQLDFLQKLELSDDEITEDFTAILYAMQVWYSSITGGNEDIFDFIGILNRLAIQHQFNVD